MSEVPTSSPRARTMATLIAIILPACADSPPGDSPRVCIADFPCAQFAVCNDDATEVVRMRSVPCQEVCPPGPCQGGTCGEAGRDPCGPGTVCVPPDQSGYGAGASCWSHARTCGGPDARPCEADAYCDMGVEGFFGSECQSLLAGRYGLCRPLSDCPSSGPVCGCKLSGDELVLATYDDDCARRAAGAALASSVPCP